MSVRFWRWQGRVYCGPLGQRSQNRRWRARLLGGFIYWFGNNHTAISGNNKPFFVWSNILWPNILNPLGDMT